MEAYDPNVAPEDYCVYGIESNNAVSFDLERLERRIMRTTPRPVRRLHFFLDTRLVQKDDLTLFNEMPLDQTPVGIASARGYTHGRSLTALVYGLLLEGGHLMIQLDMEGDEYEVLNEAAESGVFCKFVHELHNTVDVMVVLHEANSEQSQYYQEARQKIIDCGVNLFEIGHTEH